MKGSCLRLQRRYQAKFLSLMMAFVLLLCGCRAPIRVLTVEPSPPVKASALAAAVTGDTAALFEEQLATCREIYEGGRVKHEAALLQTLQNLNLLRLELQKQQEIAYLLAVADTRTLQDYTAAVNACSRAESRFFALLDECTAEKNPLTPTVQSFAAGISRPAAESAEVVAARQKMAELQQKLRADAATATAHSAAETYLSYVQAANAYAKALGFADYYEYATQSIYARDYGSDERKLLRQAVKTYLVPLYSAVKRKSNVLGAALPTHLNQLANRYITDAYDSFAEDLLAQYFATLPASVRSAMSTAFSEDLVLIGKGDTAGVTSFTAKVGEISICYFHESCLDLVTVAHELGHYYGNGKAPEGLSFDLYETHSVASSLLLCRSMEAAATDGAAAAFASYVVAVTLYQAIVSAAKDEFDETVFTSAATLTEGDLTALAERLISEYGLAELGEQATASFAEYWYKQGAERPAYHLSYTASAVAALQLYRVSENDLAAAAECYRKLAEDTDTESSFLGTVTRAGLSSPFSLAAYYTLLPLATIPLS